MNKSIHFLLFIILFTSITALAQPSEINPKTTDTDISAINIVSNNELSAELEIGGKSIRVSGKMSLKLAKLTNRWKWRGINYSTTGSGLAFGQTGAANQWNKADVVFNYRDWKTIYKSSYWVTTNAGSGFNNDNPTINSQENKDNVSNPLLKFVFKPRTVGPDCQNNADCGACP
jgi:hypothetical protein